MRALKITLLALCWCVGLYFAAALLLGNLPVHASRSPDMGDIEIFLVDNGVHSDIVLPVRQNGHDWHTVFPPQRLADPLHAELAEYIGIGWGSRRFFLHTRTWGDLDALTALEALSGTGQSVMHVSYYPSALITDKRRTVSIHVSAAEYARIVEQIRASLPLSPNGEAVFAAAGYGDKDLFYEANGRYHLFNTCNSWTNNVLKKSGLTAVIWTPFSGDVLDGYR
ncbi:TIGR02117 family protein [Conchiformibius steedae DSM 2580]|uniref:TIGR02117 family protein n=1 Tax=Conchiformibius steedae DSM 2580 TaxID=1121352 RepID=A0AAE9KYH4_9NEIS|nr:TIGR02117 family protein [Conchiformibius steedae]QMT33004.1 TIGR02117 family protein [Conchiformibius steedae]URD67627.1 TIGR02117 family protein [Conchiformibius steedae DSM 2580]